MNQRKQPRPCTGASARRAAAVLIASLGGAVVPAFAHAPIRKRTPSPHSIARTVRSVELDFADHVITGLIDVYRDAVPLTANTSGPIKRNTALRATFTAALPPGSYTVRWRALARDGHHQRGSWTFNVR